jgi:flavin-binding protein dodecin
MVITFIALSRSSARRQKAFQTQSTARSRAPARRCAFLRWFEVDRISGHTQSGRVRHYQVTLSVGFTMEEPGLGRESIFLCWYSMPVARAA